MHKLEEYGDALVELATEHDFPHWLFWGKFRQGWVRAMRGETEGIMQIRQLLNSHADVLYTNPNAQIQSLTLFAEACLATGQASVELEELEEAHRLIEKTGLRNWESYLYWSRGELLLTQATPADDAAEDCFLQALNIARHQQAKSWELRAAISLARL